MSAPAGKPTTKKAAEFAALSTPICHSLAPRIVTARTGNAKPLICEPSTLMPWPNQNRKKFAFFSSGVAAVSALVIEWVGSNGLRLLLHRV